MKYFLKAVLHQDLLKTEKFLPSILDICESYHKERKFTFEKIQYSSSRETSIGFGGDRMGKRKTDTRKCYAIKWKTSDAHSDLYSYSKDGRVPEAEF